jgi:uncharacterized membrane protein
MTSFHALLLLAAFLCSLVAGFLFAFAIVVMPGIGRLDDGGFIRTFQVIDKVIGNNQPLFVLMWVGSVLALVAAAVLGIWQLAGINRLLVIAAALVYVTGVQLPTFTINIPMNNELQRLDPGTASGAIQERARSSFEPRWNRWNAIRAVCSILVSILLLMVLLRI